MENRQKTKLSLLITTNENQQKTEVARALIYIKWNTDGVQWTRKAGILIF